MRGIIIHFPGPGWRQRVTNVAVPFLTFGACLLLTAAGPVPVDMGSASNFTILAGSAISSTSGGIINGDVGLSPAGGSLITGVTTAQVNGTIYVIDANGPAGSVENAALLSAAKNDLTTAYNDAAGRSPTTSFGAIYDLGTQTLTSGVYNGSSSFGITGTLTLDAVDDPDAVWIFQAGTTLITEPGSTVALINGAQARNVFWQVGSSATLGDNSILKGTLMALDSITLNTGSVLDGRALARNAAVTFNGQAGGLPILSVSVSPATWAAGVVSSGTNTMSADGDKLTVSNDGTVAETFTLTLADEDDLNAWTHSPLKTGATTNRYVLSGLFCAGTDAPAASAFNQVANDDVMTMTEQYATASQYAYGEGASNGVAVPVGSSRSLWLRLDAPTAGVGGIEHTIMVRVGCFQP